MTSAPVHGPMAYGGGTTLTIRRPERPSDIDLVAAGKGVRGPPVGGADSITAVPPPPDAQPVATAAKRQTAAITRRAAVRTGNGRRMPDAGSGATTCGAPQAAQQRPSRVGGPPYHEWCGMRPPWSVSYT